MEVILNTQSVFFFSVLPISAGRKMQSVFISFLKVTIIAIVCGATVIDC